MEALVICHSTIPREVGEQDKGITVLGEIHSEQPYKIVRESTREEYIEFCISVYGRTKEQVFDELRSWSGCLLWFYEIQTD